MKIIIEPIETLLRIPYLKASLKTAIIFATTRPMYYYFGCTPFLKLHVEDRPDGELLDTWQIESLIEFLAMVKDVDTLYICCDAGLSRSPAVAAFAAKYYGMDTFAQTIITNFRFLNQHLYTTLRSHLNENNSN